jgi:AcrR family transcriptional regulator
VASLTVSGSDSRRDAKHADLRARLLAATERLLDSGLSFTEISVNRLCREAGVVRSTFYAHYEDKGDLLKDLTDEILSGLGTIASEWWSQGPSLHIGEMEDIGLRLLTRFREHELLLAAVSDTAVHDAKVRAGYVELMDSFIDQVAQMIEIGRAEGVIPPGPPAHETAGMITWGFERTCYQLVPGADADALRRIAQTNAAICSRAIFGRF